MRLQVFSDVHCEYFYPGDSFGWFFGTITARDVDVLVLAGDIIDARCGTQFIEEAAARYPHVIHVPGNHEYYGGDFDAVQRTLRHLRGEVPNYIFLDNDSITLRGVRIHGSTLWYRGNPMFERHLNDGYQITKAGMLRSSAFFPQQAERSHRYLKEHVRPGDVVVTHMMPSIAVHDERYRDHCLNPFFYYDCDDIIAENKPALWLHGHSHTALRKQVGDTLCIRNPRGYLGQTIPGFDPNLVIDI